MKMQLKKRWRKLGILMAVVMVMSACSPSEKTESTGENVSETGTERVEGTQDVFGEEPSETEQNQIETEQNQIETEQNQSETEPSQPETEPSQPETEDAPEPEKPVYQPTIGQLGEQVEYLDSEELALNGMTSVKTDYLTINPVNNVSYVLADGRVNIYYCGVYCGFFCDVWLGEKAWTGDGREEQHRVFTGAREAAFALDWDLEALNPCLKGVYNCGADSFGDAGAEADFIRWGVYEDYGEWYGRDLYGWGAIFGVKNVGFGYSMRLNRGIVNEQLARALFKAVEWEEKSFTREAVDALGAEKRESENAHTLSSRELLQLAEEGKLVLAIRDGALSYTVPKPFVAIEEREHLWGLYYFDGLVRARKIGEVRVRQVDGETEGMKSEVRAVFSDEQRAELERNTGRAGMVNDFCWLTTTTVLSEDGTQVMEIERLQFGDPEYMPEGWQDAAWAEFEDYTPVEWRGGNKYVGFLDRLVVSSGEMPWAMIGDSYPAGDYDLDGRLDRLYARSGKTKYCDIYLFLSGGGVIFLGKDDYVDYSVRYSLEAYDWDGDFRPEITCSICHGGGTGFPSYSFQVYDQTGYDSSGVKWTAMELPGKDLKVKARIVDETHLKVILPEHNIEAVYEVPVGMVDDMWYGGADRSLAIDWELSEGETLFWTDPDTGERLIRTEWDIVVSKWHCQCAVIGQWGYEDGAWQLRDILPGGFDTWGMDHYLNVEKTEGDFENEVSLRITSMGSVDINGLVKDNTISGTCEIKGVSDLKTNPVRIRELNLNGEPYEADIVLYREVENEQTWLVMEYNGEKLYFEDRWGGGKDVEWLELNVPQLTGYIPFYVEELDLTLNIPENLYVYRTPGIYTDWQGKTTVLDCAEWILITDKEYTEEYMTGEMAENLSEEKDHFVYRIELVSRELYPVWNLCAFNEVDQLYVTKEGYCRYYDSGYSLQKKNEDGTEELWCPGIEWTTALLEKVEPIIGGYARNTFILTPGLGWGENLEEKYRYTMVNEVWWEGYTQAVGALLSDPRSYVYGHKMISELTELIWEDYYKYAENYGAAGDPKLINVFMDPVEDVYLRAQEYARCAAFYANLSVKKEWNLKDLKGLFVVLLEWDNGQRSFAIYTAADSLYQKSFPGAKYKKIGATYDYMVDLQASYDYMKKHMEME